MAKDKETESTYEPGRADEDTHGWAPDAPGTGEAKKRVVEGHKKAFEAHDTQDASRGEGGQSRDLTPEGVGESKTRRGEDVAEQEGKETGRYDSGVAGVAQRPYGGSTMRDSTGVDPQEPIDEDMPDLQTGDQGG